MIATSPITTKSKEAQEYFDQGLTLVYGFNHAEALRSFKEAARLDPECPMAFWGQALALAPNINDPAIGPDREQQGFEAMAESTKRRAAASPREQALMMLQSRADIRLGDNRRERRLRRESVA